MNKEQLIQYLSLVRHDEGGYYSETFRAEEKIQTQREGLSGMRSLATCIYYMLTQDNPIGYFHQNTSPIFHFFHSGSPLTYRLIHQDGSVEEYILGPDLDKGHQLQLFVPGGCWKSTELQAGGDYGLLSEIVTPGFEFIDAEIANQTQLLKEFPQHESWIRQFTYQ